MPELLPMEIELDPAESLETLVVGIGDGLATDRVDCELATYGLGSCIAVTLYDQRRLVGAMAHMMLPDSSQATGDPPGGRFAFVDQGVAQLLRETARLGSGAADLEAWIVGGASMYSHGAPETIGTRNAGAAWRALERAGVRIVGVEIGGCAPRQARLSLATGDVRLRSS